MNKVTTTITGVPKRAFERYVGTNGQFDLNKLIPVPWFEDDTYEWRKSRWGCAGDVFDTKYFEETNTVMFNTWESGPLYVVRALSDAEGLSGELSMIDVEGGDWQKWEFDCGKMSFVNSGNWIETGMRSSDFSDYNYGYDY